jgi:hypothetical protein
MKTGSSPTFAEWRGFALLGERPQAIFEAAFPQHLPKKTPIGAK